MKTKLLLSLALTATLAAHVFCPPPTALAQTDAPLAVLMSCTGDVSVVKTDGSVHRAVFGMPLEAGDEIRTGEESQAEILFENGNYITVGAGSDMIMRGSRNRTEPAEPTSPMGEESFELAQNYLKLQTAQGTSSIAGLRSSDRGEELRAVSPRQTMVSVASPVFIWESADPSEELRLTVYNDDGVLWQHNVHGEKQLQYPSDAPALEAGPTYSWTLETTDPLRYPPLRSGAAYFGLIPADEISRVSKALAAIDNEQKLSESSRHVMRASVFFNAKLLADAIDETEKAVALSPGDKTLRSILARLYQETGRVNEAVDLYNEIMDK